jgi:ribosomal-protein-alanine N-acetyltransferase
MFEYASDIGTTRYVSFLPHKTMNDTREAIAYSLGKWAIMVKENNKMIGMINFVNLEKATGEVGYIVNKVYWGKGYILEALLAVLDLSVHVLHLEYGDVLNPNSGRVLEKVGMREFGRIPKFYVLAKEKIVVVKCWGIAKEDYFENH